MKIEDVEEHSIETFLNQLGENSRKGDKYPRTYYKQYLREVLNVKEDNVTLSLARGLGATFHETPVNVMKLMADKYITAAAIKDLLSFCLLSGVSAYKARVEDKKDEEVFMYNGHIQQAINNQEFFISLRKDICPFIDTKPDNMAEKLANLAEAHGEGKIYYDPLSVMNDEMGVVDYFHIPED